MEDPKVKIGGRDFVVPEYSIKQQRSVTPMLMEALEISGAISDPEKMGRVFDIVFDCLTIKDSDGKQANEITKDDFENLKSGAIHISTVVMPVLLKQAGLERKESSEGGAGQAAPQTPLNGETTITT